MAYNIAHRLRTSLEAYRRQPDFEKSTHPSELQRRPPSHYIPVKRQIDFVLVSQFLYALRRSQGLGSNHNITTLRQPNLQPNNTNSGPTRWPPTKARSLILTTHLQAANSPFQVEHSIPAPPPPSATTPQRAPRRPDLSTFFSTLELVDTSGEHRSHNNSHAVPVPGDISAAFRTLADAFERMRQDNGGDENGLLQSLVESLMGDAESPPREVQGVPDSFLDGECDSVRGCGLG